MGHISPLPNKLHPTGIQLNSIKVTSVGHRRAALLSVDFQTETEQVSHAVGIDDTVYTYIHNVHYVRCNICIYEDIL